MSATTGTTASTASTASTAARGMWTHVDGQGREFAIGHASSLEELDACIALQQHTWGYSDLEVVPRNIYVLAQALGGQVLCAWDADATLAGFAMAVAAHEPAPGSAASHRWMRALGSAEIEADGLSRSAPAPQPYLHSHLLAVAARYQSSGLGRALKFAQRELALAAGLDCMRWTFDPLMARNAAFNLNRLGATVGRYIPNFYGGLSSVLQGGTPTDRFLAEWELRSPRVQAACSDPVAAPRVDLAITLTPHVARWKAAGDIEAMQQVQHDLRERFSQAFMHGLRATGFTPDGKGGGEYLLTAAQVEQGG